MSSRTRSFVALALGTLAVLGTLMLMYGLVYPSGARNSKVPLVWAIAGGTGCALLAVVLSLVAHRRASKESERFFALLALTIAGFFMFVMALGFGIPAFVLGLHD